MKQVDEPVPLKYRYLQQPMWANRLEVTICFRLINSNDVALDTSTAKEANLFISLSLRVSASALAFNFDANT